MARIDDVFKFLGREEEKISTLSPDQQRVSRPLSNQIRRRIVQGPEAFGGQLSAPISDLEQESVGQLVPAATQATTDLLETDIGELNQRFNRDVARPAQRRFLEESLPAALEDVPGFSTELVRQRGRLLRDFSENLSNLRFQSVERARDRANQAVGNLPTVAQTAAVPREIEQAGLDREFSEFLRQNQAARDDLNRGLEFLGVQTQAVIPGRSGFDRYLDFISVLASAAQTATAASGGGA